MQWTTLYDMSSSDSAINHDRTSGLTFPEACDFIPNIEQYDFLRFVLHIVNNDLVRVFDIRQKDVDLLYDFTMTDIEGSNVVNASFKFFNNTDGTKFMEISPGLDFFFKAANRFEFHRLSEKPNLFYVKKIEGASL